MARLIVVRAVRRSRFDARAVAMLIRPFRRTEQQSMQRYPNRSGDSGVLAYEIGPDSITVRFATGTYVYNYEKPGEARVEQMKRLAKEGRGLATYIAKHVGNNFATKTW